MDALFWKWKYPPWVIELLEEDDLTDGTLESLESLKKHLKSEKKSGEFLSIMDNTQQILSNTKRYSALNIFQWQLLIYDRNCEETLFDLLLSYWDYHSQWQVNRGILYGTVVVAPRNTLTHANGKTRHAILGALSLYCQCPCFELGFPMRTIHGTKIQRLQQVPAQQ